MFLMELSMALSAPFPRYPESNFNVPHNTDHVPTPCIIYTGIWKKMRGEIVPIKRVECEINLLIPRS